jgi:hypothetical protein
MMVKFAITLSLLMAIGIFVACSDNLFGSDSSISSDTRSLRIDAENAFRRGDYQKAYDICSKIVEIDPTVSFGYFGMAKAALWKEGVNPYGLFSFYETDDDKVPFMDTTAVVQNKYFQMMKKVAAALSELDRRDSLTRPRNSLTKPSSPPLSDMEYDYGYYGGILLIASVTKGLLGMLDINKDGCIAVLGEPGGEPGIDYPAKKNDREYDTKWKDWGCSKGAKGYTTDLPVTLMRNAEGKIIVSIKTNEFLNNTVWEADSPIPDDVQGFNDKLDNFTGDMDDVLEMLEFMGMEGDSESGDLKSDIDKYKDNAVFFRVGTHIDEDGDGCIDEDLLDGQDNDGDGLKNGNARLSSVDPKSSSWGKSGINHSMFTAPGTGTDVKDPVEDLVNVNHERNMPMPMDAPVYIPNSPGISPKDCKDNPACTELWGDDSVTVTVIRFTQDEGYWTTNDAELKLKIAKDTICPPTYSLKDRQKLIGGCWRNYDDDKFVKYWLKRGLARKDDKEKRIHPDCKKCTSTENCLGTKYGN